MDIFAFVVTLLLVMDPFGNIPVFISVLSSVEKKRRTLIVFRELLIALAVLLLFLFAGKYILAGLHLSNQALSVAGGVVLFLIAIKMIFPSSPQANANQPQREPLIVPLAVPLVAGPSAISYLILSASTAPDDMGLAVLGVLIAWAITTAVLTLSGFFARILGERVLEAIERLMGMILITLAIQMLLDGLMSYIKTI